MKKTRNDILLIISLVAVAGCLFLASKLFMKQGAYVEVKVAGEHYASYRLDKDDTIYINTQYGSNTLVISDAKAYISDADCPDKLCVHFSAVYKDKQSIICLPHKLVVEVNSDDDNSLDTVVN